MSPMKAVTEPGCGGTKCPEKLPQQRWIALLNRSQENQQDEQPTSTHNPTGIDSLGDRKKKDSTEPAHFDPHAYSREAKINQLSGQVDSLARALKSLKLYKKLKEEAKRGVKSRLEHHTEKTKPIYELQLQQQAQEIKRLKQTEGRLRKELACVENSSASSTPPARRSIASDESKGDAFSQSAATGAACGREDFRAENVPSTETQSMVVFRRPPDDNPNGHVEAERRRSEEEGRAKRRDAIIQLRLQQLQRQSGEERKEIKDRLDNQARQFNDSLEETMKRANAEIEGVVRRFHDDIDARQKCRPFGDLLQRVKDAIPSIW